MSLTKEMCSVPNLVECESRFLEGHGKYHDWIWCLSFQRRPCNTTFNLCLNDRAITSPKTNSGVFAKFLIQITEHETTQQPVVTSPVYKFLFGSDSTFSWAVGFSFHAPFKIFVGFLDVSYIPLNVTRDSTSTWSFEETAETLLSSRHDQRVLRCLSLFLQHEIHADVTIKTADNGTLRAHKALLCASSPVFRSMFLHEFKEILSSTIEIQDMSLESCKALLSYFYGTINEEDVLHHRLALLDAADKYDIEDLREYCDQCLIPWINSENVIERLQEAWHYNLKKLKEGCFKYLFEYGKAHDILDEVTKFLMHADRELIAEMFQQLVIKGMKPF